ncbi:MAG: type I-C CRISPR-associated protein Cas5c [Bryobacteraceae bacterium]
MPPNHQILEAWGDLACFSPPTAKAERFSYAVPTPSAVRGIFDAIYCKPAEFRWQVTQIEILKPVRYLALRRNEVKEKVSTQAVIQWMAGRRHPEPIMADVDASYWGTDTRGRTQRQTMALRDVRYRLHATARPWPGYENRLPALEAQFRRRAAQGKCVWQPCFGCREFPAYFRLIEPQEPLDPPQPLDLDLGWMVYDTFDLSRPGTNHDAPAVSVFRAQVKNGVLHVPPYESPEVRKAAEQEVSNA